MEIPVHRVQVIKSIQRDQGYKIIATSQQGAVMLERISDLEQDCTRLRGILDVTSQRVARLQRWETMPNTRFGATMTREAADNLIARRMAEVLEARDTARNLEPLAECGDEHEDKNHDDYEGGNEGGNKNGNGNEGVNRNGNGGGNGDGNGNGNRGGNGCGNHNVNFKGFMPVARDALTWWNSHKRTIRVDAAYAMRWTELMKLMTEVYCPRNEIQKMETEIVLDEEDKVERFQGNVIAAEPTRLQDVIHIANNLMDQKLKGYARNAENKRRFENNPRDNRGQQPSFKRKNVGSQNVARAYTAGNNEKKG
ncbi:hypothetical protein Tco_1205814, partial [Tanacetum coccineum]